MIKKRIPALTSNFASLIEGGGYYVDKTFFITELEDSNFPGIFFLRPRRFGKSLHLSMLEYYYGKQYREKFQTLFGGYFIGQPENTTPLRNSYYILKFNFSGINTQIEDEIREKFDAEIARGIRDFATAYPLFQKKEILSVLEENRNVEMFKKFISLFLQNVPGGKIYVLIDEYDHFTNELFSFNKDHFSQIVARNGWVRKFYETIKIYMGEGIIDRFFATGVTPVTLDSMTSGFNIAQNITLDKTFHEMAGFTEDELRLMIQNTIWEPGRFDPETLLKDMRLWYNGSKFSVDADQRLYNPQMVISFLSAFSRDWKYPDQMADINVTSDYKKIANILMHLSPEESDAVTGEILNNEGISEKLTLRFNFELPYTRIEAVSLLFYNGLLTINDSKFQVFDFVIPNHIIKVMYWEYFRFLFESRHQIRYESVPVRDALIEMSESGRIDKLVNYVNKVLNSLSNRDLQQFSEKNIKMIFMTLLMGNNAYFVKSEHETDKGYADLLLLPTQLNPGKFNFLLELKYVKTGNSKKTEALKTEETAQLSRYKSSLASEGINCKSFVVIFTGKSDYDILEI